MIIREERIGNQRLILGDCLQVLGALGRFDAVVTDAPFGITDAPLTGSADRPGGKRIGVRSGGTATWFKPSDWDKSLDPAFGAVCGVAPLVVWFGQWRKREEVAGFMRWPLRAEIIWAKDTHVGPPSPVAARDERIWVFAEKGVKGATFETSVWDHPIIPTWAHKHHKNEKPVSLMVRLIKWTGAQTILDPFAGSGTSAVACQRMGLACTAIEQDADHFETMCRRVDEAARQPDLLIPETRQAPKQEAMDI